MKAVAWMAAASVASWVVAAAVVGTPLAVEVLFGMIGPLAAASGSWLLAERTFRRHPERLTSLMAASFGVKLLFFGVYVVVGVRIWPEHPVPFVVSFTSYFIGLYAIEALLLRRLFVER
jgi:hypothetical protein